MSIILKKLKLKQVDEIKTIYNNWFELTKKKGIESLMIK